MYRQHHHNKLYNLWDCSGCRLHQMWAVLNLLWTINSIITTTNTIVNNILLVVRWFQTRKNKRKSFSFIFIKSFVGFSILTSSLSQSHCYVLFQVILNINSFQRRFMLVSHYPPHSYWSKHYNETEAHVFGCIVCFLIIASRTKITSLCHLVFTYSYSRFNSLKVLAFHFKRHQHNRLIGWSNRFVDCSLPTTTQVE